MPKLKRREIEAKKKKMKIILIVIIVSIVLILAILGVILYYYFKPSSDNNNNTTRKITINKLPQIFYNNTVPICNQSSCLKIGESILLNQILQSTSKVINITLKYNLYSEESSVANIYGIEILSQEEASNISSYLLFNNTYANIYKYIKLTNNKCKLDSRGLICDNKLIKFISYTCNIDNKKYFCDLTYIKIGYVLLCNESAEPVGIITVDDYNYLKSIYDVQEYRLTNIVSILLTNYSILVFNSKTEFIGIISL
jgi:flagellar basal body-associated protein FliL